MELVALDFWYLVGIACAFLVIEMMSTDFISLWFGFGFATTAIVHYFFPFDTLLAQLALALGLGALYLLLLRKQVKQYIFRDDDGRVDNFLNVEGEGFIEGELLKYKGTLWKYHTSGSEVFKEAERVHIIKITDNIALIDKIN
jgi:membrane protein implicated in regulation of membrane protease activity